MRTAPVAILTAVGVIAAVGVGVAVASDSDDARQVGAVGVGAVTVDESPTTDPTADPTSSASPSASSSASPAAAAQQVAGLEQLQGVLTRDDDSDDSDDDGDDRADFEVAGVDLDLGPDEWVVSTGALADFDGNGTLRPLIEELEGLVGQEVTVSGRFDDDDSDDSDDSSDDHDDDLSVYELQGLTFRDSAGGPAPWQTAGTGATGEGPSIEELSRIAVDAVGADSRVDSVDREDDGGAAWEVEVVDAYGEEQRVLLDADGTVLDIRPED